MKKTKLIHQEPQISWADFTKIEMRVGTVLAVEHFEEAKKPAYKFLIDFGDFGRRKSSAQVTTLYTPDELIGKQIIAVINFPRKQIANIQSECLILGAVDRTDVSLMTPDRLVLNGLRIG